MLVLFDDPPGGGFAEALMHAIGGEVRVCFDLASCPAADVRVLVRGRPQRSDIEGFAGLQALVIPYAGVPKRTLDVMGEFEHISIHNLHHNAAPTAEFALALLLAAAKRVLPVDAEMRRHDWSSRYTEERALLLEGKRALVLGLGAIGQRVAGLLSALGMRVSGVRRNPNRPCAACADVLGLEQLDGALVAADVVMVCLPATAQTRGLLDARRIGRLKPGVVLVNVARGDIIDEPTLFDALVSRRIGAAGLDVWYHYPSAEADRQSTHPSVFPFESLDNVVLSPHRSGHSDQTEALRGAALAQLLNALAAGKTQTNRVDLTLGY